MIISYFWIDWRWETYTINPNSMTHCSGIFLRNKEFYALESIRSITVRQHLFGLLMGYGNIRLYSPFSEEPHRIKQIPNPMRTAEEIENILPDDIPIDQVGLQILSHQEHRNLQKTKTEHDTLQKNPKEIPYS